MTRMETGGEFSLNRPLQEERGDAAALAAKVVNLTKQPTSSYWWACYFLVWLVTLSLAVAAALRITFHDGIYFLTWLNAFTRYVYLPAYPCLAWAAWQRRWILALVAALVVGCHAVWLAPNILPDRRFDQSVEAAAAPVDSSQILRIFFANVWMDNREYQGLLEEIAEHAPDVVVVVEFHPRWYTTFKKSPVMRSYTHGAGSFRSYLGMVSVFSKVPLKMEVKNRISRRTVVTVEIELGQQTLRLIGLHAPRPMYLRDYDYDSFWKQIVPLVTAEQGPLVVVGDFNATEHSFVYKQLRSAGLRSAHDDRGRGYATTWPNGQLLLPPIRIDQAFLSPHVECERIVEGRGLGSDHKPLILDVRLRTIRPQAASRRDSQ